MRIKRPITILFLITIFFACDRPKCTNTNPVFEKCTPDNKEYKDELAKVMTRPGKETLRFWFDKSQQNTEKEIYELFVQGDNVCAKIIVENKSNRKRLGDGGYRGAELKGVKILTEQNSDGTNFVLEKIDRIID